MLSDSDLRATADPAVSCPQGLDLGYTPGVAFPEFIEIINRYYRPHIRDDDRDDLYPANKGYVQFDRNLLSRSIELLDTEARRHPGQVLPFVPLTHDVT